MHGSDVCLSKGQGFFYMHDAASAKQLKDRSSSVVISVIEGIASCREIENEFTKFFASGWRCTARQIGPDKYVMRFPNAREVEKACYQDRFTMCGCAATLRLTHWTTSVGAKAELNIAWVRVSNIPTDKRTERNASFDASLVGVPLEIDTSTLHKPEYVRVLLGCRDIT